MNDTLVGLGGGAGLFDLGFVFVLVFVFVCVFVYVFVSVFVIVIVNSIPDICHFFYTGKKNWPKILHPKVRDLRKIEFRDKIA